MTRFHEDGQILNPTLHRPVEILLIEDSPSDAKLTVIALREARIANNVHIVVDGVEAMQYLRQEGPFAQEPRPDLVLLDLNLPKMDGREVLAEIKADDSLKVIPIVVLTTSAAEGDVLRAYSLQASGYITKPVNLDEFMKAVYGIEEFWLALVRLPTVSAAAARPSAS